MLLCCVSLKLSFLQYVRRGYNKAHFCLSSFFLLDTMAENSRQRAIASASVCVSLLTGWEGKDDLARSNKRFFCCHGNVYGLDAVLRWRGSER